MTQLTEKTTKIRTYWSKTPEKFEQSIRAFRSIYGRYPGTVVVSMTKNSPPHTVWTDEDVKRFEAIGYPNVPAYRTYARHRRKGTKHLCEWFSLIERETFNSEYVLSDNHKWAQMQLTRTKEELLQDLALVVEQLGSDYSPWFKPAKPNEVVTWDRSVVATAARQNVTLISAAVYREVFGTLEEALRLARDFRKQAFPAMSEPTTEEVLTPEEATPVEASVVKPATELPQGQLGASLNETTPQQTLALLVDRFTNIHQISNQVVMQNAQMQRMMNLTSNEISELKRRSNEMSSEHAEDLAAKDAEIADLKSWNETLATTVQEAQREIERLSCLIANHTCGQAGAVELSLDVPLFTEVIEKARTYLWTDTKLVEVLLGQALLILKSKS